MKIRYIITVTLAVVGLASIIFPWIIKSWASIPAADICSKFDVTKLGERDMCIPIVTEIQKEVQANGVQGMRNVPTNLICQNINHDGDPECIKSVGNIMALLPL